MKENLNHKDLNYSRDTLRDYQFTFDDADKMTGIPTAAFLCENSSPEIVGHVEILWSLEKQFFPVWLSFKEIDGHIKITYTDGDEGTINMSNKVRRQQSQNSEYNTAHIIKEVT